MIDLLNIPFGKRYVGYWGNGYGNQKEVSSLEDIKLFIDEHLGVDNIGISISTYKNNLPYLLFLPFDFDSDTLHTPWQEAKRLYNHAVNCGYESYLIFSGSKGFHVLIRTEPKVYTKKQMKIVQRMFKNMMLLSTLDEQIFGDIRRIMRIPWTYNIKGGVCKLLAHSPGNKLDLDLIFEDQYLDSYSFSGEHGENIYHDYPCIESLVRNDIEPRHIIRFTYVVLKLDEGYSEDEIIDEIESFGWIDFNEDYTRKQIQHIEQRGYVPTSCSTLKEMGYCVVENCKYENGNISNELKEVGIK
jgi:hypothetical protein